MKKYQLVVQFRMTSQTDFDRLTAFEDTLYKRLPPLGKVDGHDWGTGEFNIFILTDEPQETFDVVEQIRLITSPEYDPIVAYRELLGEENVVLWPPGHRVFAIA